MCASVSTPSRGRVTARLVLRGQSLGQRSDASRGPGLRGRPDEAAATQAPRHSGKGLEEETLTRTQSPLEKRNLSTLTDSPTHLVTISLHPFLHSL